MFVLRSRVLTRSAILTFITFLHALRISESFQWLEKEVNQSVAVKQSITLSWNITYTAQEINQSQTITFKRYPQHDSSAVVKIGSTGIVEVQMVGLIPFSNSPFEPRIVVKPVSSKATAVTEPAITIKDLAKQDEAFYRIEVTIGGTAIASHTIFLMVFVPAKVLSITPNNTYVRGSRVELVCSVEGDPPLYVAWIDVTEGSVLQNRTVNTSYVIPSVSSHHKGTYRCVAENKHKRDSRETTITDVFVGATISRVTNESRPVCEGEQVVLTCEAEGNPKPYVVWKRNGIVLQNSTNTSYTISSVKRGDQGSYTCEATNVAGSVSRIANITKVQFPAKVLSITPNNPYVTGSRVELNCSVEGDPPPYVAWINVTDGSVLQNRTVNTSYVIPSVSFQHKGTYRCETGNRCGKDNNETNITDVFVGATITSVVGKSQPICEGEQVVLTCEAEGIPKPKVVWKRNGKELQNSINTSYTISSVKRGDEGNYTCEATNVVRSVSDITSIADVQFPAKVLSITPNGNYTKNTSVELVCSVEGDPPPYVAWINVTDGSVLQNRTVNTSYVIPSVSSHHKGTYRCVTGNRCGNDSNEMTIVAVYYKPTIQNITGLSYPVCEGREVTLNCSATGYPSPYVVWINARGAVVQNSTSVAIYTVSDVRRKDEGSYTCSASNTAGKDVDSTRILDVQCKCGEEYVIPCHENLCFGNVVSSDMKKLCFEFNPQSFNCQVIHFNLCLYACMP